jgi:hypothetical protein
VEKVRKFAARKKQSRRSRPRGSLDLSEISGIGDSGVGVPKLDGKSCDIVRRDIPTRSEPFIFGDTCQETLSSRGFGTRKAERKTLSFAGGEVARRREPSISRDTWQRIPTGLRI